jgi:hypothetical protein
MIKLQGAPAAGGALAGEANRGINRDPIEPRVSISVVLQSGQRPPDLEENFLIQVFLVGRIPFINAADLENPVSILIHQLQKPVFVCRRRIQSWTFI